MVTGVFILCLVSLIFPLVNYMLLTVGYIKHCESYRIMSFTLPPARRLYFHIFISLCSDFSPPPSLDFEPAQ